MRFLLDRWCCCGPVNELVNLCTYLYLFGWNLVYYLPVATVWRQLVWCRVTGSEGCTSQHKVCILWLVKTANMVSFVIISYRFIECYWICYTGPSL